MNDNLFLKAVWSWQIVFPLKRKEKMNYYVSTIAGIKDTSGYVDGIGEKALFSNPLGICLDKQKNLYICDSENKVIRQITPNGMVSTLVSKGIYFISFEYIMVH